MIKIHADMRESATIAELKQYPDVHVEVGSLPTGDFRIGQEVIVERKTAIDFVQSIRDKRLFEQVAKMKISFERPIIFIEGDVYATRSEISEDGIDGALSWLTVVEKVSVIHLTSRNQLSRMLVRMAKQAQGDFNEPVLRTKKPTPHALMARYLIEGLPGVGAGSAAKILTHFGSVRAAINASVDDYRKIDGVGKKTAEKIVEAVNWQVEGDLKEVPA